MDPELLNEIRDSVIKAPHVRELDDVRAKATCDSAASRFIEDVSATWWWESIRGPFRAMNYDGADAFSVLRSNIGDLELVRLVVTDDEPQPWPVFEGPLEEILVVLQETRYFEYFLVPGVNDGGRWIVFDTHHNQLVWAGEMGASTLEK